MDSRTAICVAVIVLLFLSGPIFAGLRKAYEFFKTRVPSGAGVANVFAWELTLPAWKVAVLLGVFWFASGGVSTGGCTLPAFPSWPNIATSKPALIVMLHEASHGPLSIDAKGAANELTSAGRSVRMVDDDVTDGTNETPDWLKPALEPGRAIMGGTDGKEHAVILLSGERVVKAIKLPASKAEILEACK